MNREKKTLLLLEALCGVLIVAMFSVVSFWPAAARPAAGGELEAASPPPAPTSEPMGSIKARVLDVADDCPVPGALIVVPETGRKYATDDEGYTELIYAAEGAARFGELTLIVYKQGYVATALLHVQAAPGELRVGPVIRIFADDGSMSGEAISLIETPDPEWVRDMVDKHRPDGF